MLRIKKSVEYSLPDAVAPTESEFTFKSKPCSAAKRLARGLAKSRSELLANDGNGEGAGAEAGGGFGCEGGVGAGAGAGAAGAAAALVGGESSTKDANAAISFSSSTMMHTN